MKTRYPKASESAAGNGSREPLSSTPRGATGEPRRPLPPGLFSASSNSRDPTRPKEGAMNEFRINAVGRYAARAAILAAGIYLALAVGAPWLLLDAPPSPQDVVAAKVCCFKAVGAADARPARP
jgi:hypothetical protein